MEQNESRPHFSLLPPTIRALWAKSGQHGGHSLLAHMLGVVAVAEAILELEPATTHQHLAGRFGLDPDAAPRWLAALVGLHDVGKAISGFQDKWAEGRAQLEATGLIFSDRLLACNSMPGINYLKPIGGCCHRRVTCILKCLIWRQSPGWVNVDC